MSVLKKLWRLPRGRIGLCITLAVMLVAVLAPVLAPYNPYDIDQRDSRRLPPGRGHWLGTDTCGNDILSKLIYGARVSLMVGLCAGLAVTW